MLPIVTPLQRGCSGERPGRSPEGSLVLPAGQAVIPVRLLHFAGSALTTNFVSIKKI